MRLHNTQLGVFVPGSVNNAQLQTPFTGMGRLGEFVPGCYPVPFVPVKTSLSGLGCSSCSNGPEYGLVGGRGLGTVDDLMSSFTDVLTNDGLISGIPNVLVVGGGLYLLFSIIGDTKRGARRVGTGYARRKTAASAAREAYRASLAAA